jgi:hypothetical protein
MWQRYIFAMGAGTSTQVKTPKSRISKETRPTIVFAQASSSAKIITSPD